MIDLEGRVRAMRTFLWFFRGGVVLYAIIGLLIYKASGHPAGFVNLPGPTYLLVAMILVAMATAAVGFLTFFLPARLTDPERLVRLPGMNRLSAVVAQLQRAFMISVSGANTVAVLGLVLFLLNGRILDLFGFTVAALAVLAVTTPQRDHWEEIVRIVRARRSDWTDVW